MRFGAVRWFIFLRRHFFFWKTLVALIERRVEAVSLADTVSNKQQKS